MDVPQKCSGVRYGRRVKRLQGDLPLSPFPGTGKGNRLGEFVALR